MCQFTNAIPTGNGEIGVGTDVCIGVGGAFNTDLGCGQVTALAGTHFSASGKYAFDDPLGPGTWGMTFTSADGGGTWDVFVTFSQPLQLFLAAQAVTCSEDDSGTTTITYNASSGAIVQTFQNDSFWHKAKLLLSIPLGDTWNFYLYNAKYYRCCADGCPDRPVRRSTALRRTLAGMFDWQRGTRPRNPRGQ